VSHLPSVVADFFDGDGVVRESRDDGGRQVSAWGWPTCFKSSHEIAKAADIEVAVLKVDEDHVGPGLGQFDTGVVGEVGCVGCVEGLSFF
jgi:hypothetical protein